MNSIEDQSSGDSYTNCHLTTNIAEHLPIFHPEPGTSLANAIGEQMLAINLNKTIQPIESMLSHTESNNDSERQSLNDSENPKYKTELCRNFSVYGFCSYSTRCQFAHGLEELRCRNRHPKYKTELCRNFLSGYCKYGSRCQFLHDSDETNDTEQSNDISSTSPTVTVATIGTYLLTNMIAQSAAFGLGGPIAQKSALATLAACANFHPKSNSTESPLRRTTYPMNCGIEMQQIPHLHLSPNFFHGISIPQNQNNNDSQLSAIHISSEDIQTQNFNNKRIRKSSAHI